MASIQPNFALRIHCGYLWLVSLFILLSPFSEYLLHRGSRRIFSTMLSHITNSSLKVPPHPLQRKQPRTRTPCGLAGPEGPAHLCGFTWLSLSSCRQSPGWLFVLGNNQIHSCFKSFALTVPLMESPVCARLPAYPLFLRDQTGFPVCKLISV